MPIENKHQVKWLNTIIKTKKKRNMSYGPVVYNHCRVLISTQSASPYNSLGPSSY